VHGAQIRKAVDALLATLDAAARAGGARSPRVVELALALAWLLSSGRRTRRAIESAVRADGAMGALASTLGDEPAVRARVDALA
jgi:Ca-activated chloride channel family protein